MLEIDGAGRSSGPHVSIIVPARNEAENLPDLIDEIAAAMAQRRFEVIVIDDGSDDDSDRLLRDLQGTRSWLTSYRHDVSSGQSVAVRTGLLNAAGDLVATIDGDGENDPAYIPRLIDALNAAGPDYGMAAGQRVRRKATRFKRFASWIANHVRGAMLNDGTRDSGCGLKVVRRSLFLRLPYFDSWHRFLPALVIREGYRVVHVDVVDRQRRFGRSNYGVWDRLLVGIPDLIGVWWLRRRRQFVPSITEIGSDIHDRND